MSSYEASISGIRILPGCWRPHYPFEQIAWISPPWPSHDYIWYDFPEAIFTNIGLLFLSHVNPAFPVLFPNLPKVIWEELPRGIAFERSLPNGISFGGSLIMESDNVVATELHMRNGSDQDLENITLQTCVFLRAMKEFSEFTADNKFVHLPESGWLPFPKAAKFKAEKGTYRLGWRGGSPSADLPVMVTMSREAERLVAVTWFENTYSLVTNPSHPCMHADPSFPVIKAGGESSIRGEVSFYEGGLEDFGEWFFRRSEEQSRQT